MNDFTFENRTKIVFGKHAVQSIGGELKAASAKKVLVVYGRSSAEKSGLLDKVVSSIESSGLKAMLYGGVSANPLLSHAQQGIEAAKKEGVDFILAVGGGSVIDAAKFIAIGAVDSKVWEYYTTSGEAKTALPIGAVLTLPAAGSEGSSASVIREDKTGLKFACMSDAIIPKFSFVDPSLMFTLPKEQIAFGASDILAHLFERYFSPQKSVILTDKLLGGAINALMDISAKLYNDNQNYDLWAEFCLLGTLAHNGFLSIGRDNQDWGTHYIENRLLSGKQNIAHGAGLAIVFLGWLKMVAKKAPKKIIEWATDVMSEKTIEAAIKKLERFYRALNLATTLKECKIDPKAVLQDFYDTFSKEIVLGGYGKLTYSEIEQLLKTL